MPLSASRLVIVWLGGRYGRPRCHLGRVSAVVMLLTLSPASQRPRRRSGFTSSTSNRSDGEEQLALAGEDGHGVGEGVDDVVVAPVGERFELGEERVVPFRAD